MNGPIQKPASAKGASYGYVWICANVHTLSPVSICLGGQTKTPRHIWRGFVLTCALLMQAHCVEWGHQGISRDQDGWNTKGGPLGIVRSVSWVHSEKSGFYSRKFGIEYKICFVSGSEQQQSAKRGQNLYRCLVRMGLNVIYTLSALSHDWRIARCERGVRFECQDLMERDDMTFF